MKTSKNILVITVAGIVGGMEKLFLTAMPLLRQRGYDFIFCVDENGPAIHEYQRLGFKCFVIEAKGLKAVKEMEDIIQGYKINLVHNNEICLEAAWAANNCGVSHLLHLHGKIKNVLEGNLPKLIKKRVSFVCRLSDFAIGCSQFVTNQLKGFIDPSRLACIYGGVPIKKLISPKPRSNKRLKTVGMMAHFYPLKRHRDFILAARHVLDTGLDANFFIAGHCWVNYKPQELYFKYLNGLVRELGLQHKFKLYKGLKDITRLYKEMDIFVLPSIGEGLSNALLEAMQFAKPVIVTRSGSLPEVVRHQENGFLVGEKRPKEIAQTIIKLSRDESLARKVGQNARKTVEERFDIHRFVQELAVIYDSLI